MVGMDFVVGLPKSRGCTIIWVITNHFSKMVHLVPLPRLPSARALAALFIKHIFRLHGMPDKIVSDRGPQFASRFWRELCHLLSIELNLSSTYHPETNGLVERANQTLVTYLRHFVSARQDDWASLLSWAEFALNNSVADSTGQTPFLLNYGQHPRVPVPMPVSSADSRVADWAVEAWDIWDRTQDAIRASKERMRSSTDAHRRPAPTFAPGDLVWLSARNIRLRVESTKFAPRYLGPFKVLEQVNPVVYRLALPPRLGITDTFPVSLLKPVYMSRFSESSAETSGSSTDDFEVNAILGFKVSVYACTRTHGCGDKGTEEDYEDLIVTVAGQIYNQKILQTGWLSLLRGLHNLRLGPGETRKVPIPGSFFRPAEATREKKRTRRGLNRSKKHGLHTSDQIPGTQPLVVNISSKSLGVAEHSVLQKGLSYCPSYKHNTFQMDMDLQKFYRSLRLKLHFSQNNQVTSSTVQSPPVGITAASLGLRDRSTYQPPKGSHPLETFIHFVDRLFQKLRNDTDRGLIHYPSNLSVSERQALKLLQQEKDIIIKPADKGGAIVVMDKLHYKNEVYRQLGDTTTYKKLSHNPTTSIQNTIKTTLDEFQTRGILDGKTRDFLTKKHPITPVIYILPKIHKDLHNPPARIKREPACTSHVTPTLVSAKPSSGGMSETKVRGLKRKPEPIGVNPEVILCHHSDQTSGLCVKRSEMSR
ncbi:unnamed protein product [Ranitomeya imitator]|uniref:Integrase catalytic domain-containing protein n=1 Tax=Ranitomeya imitator TaxID=111125 RepID=A0ABN9MP83_9NEOB|nr:unnamed protein product [Ranitomeya imitator]